MRRILLTCITLVLPQLVVAAPCDILPYANQCQGSNLWPVPAGWLPDGNVNDLVKGDCLPSPPVTMRGAFGYDWYGDGEPNHCVFDNLHADAAGWLLHTYPSATALTSAASLKCPYVCAGVGYYGGSVNAIDVSNGNRKYRCDCITAGGDTTRIPAGSLAMFNTMPNCYTCPSGYTKATTFGWCNRTGTNSTYPPDSKCTARWTSSAQAELQPNPQDSDCPDSCVKDGSCRLR